MICLEAPVDPIELPRKHSYCRGCVAQLREKGVSQSCPLCRAPLPLGAEQLFDMGWRVWAKIARAVGSKGEWPVLTSEQQSEMDGAILMLEEAMAQVSDGCDRRGSVRVAVSYRAGAFINFTSVNLCC